MGNFISSEEMNNNIDLQSEPEQVQVENTLIRKLDNDNIVEAKRYSCCHCTDLDTEDGYIQRAKILYKYKGFSYPLCDNCFNGLWGAIFKKYEEAIQINCKIIEKKYETIIDDLVETTWDINTNNKCRYCRCFDQKNIKATKVLTHNGKDLHLCDECYEHLEKPCITSTEKRLICDVLVQ